MSNDGPYWQCSGCGRKSWAAKEVGRVCAMPQPNGQTCTGRFLVTQPAPSGDEADEEFHAHCLNLTVDEARLICECGSGMRTHVFGGHRSCEYFEHHCDSCHERGICTAHVPVLSKLLALVPVPGAPSGDEAKVREINEKWALRRMGGWNEEHCRREAIKEALSTGKADCARRIERLRKKLDKAERQRDEARADLRIARRGSEGE